MFILLLKAFAFGIAVAAPIGPMGVLCMRRILSQGWKSGIATGLGIAACDGLYAAIAVMGLTGISAFIRAHEITFYLVAGLFIGCFGLKIFFSKHEPITLNNDPSSLSLPYAVGSAFFLTLTNPLTILFFVTAFAALTPATGFDYVSGVVAIVSVFSGSFVWYIGVVAIVSYFHNVISDRKRMLIDKIIGIFLVLMGVWEFLRISIR